MKIAFAIATSSWVILLGAWVLLGAAVSPVAVMLWCLAAWFALVYGLTLVLT